MREDRIAGLNSGADVGMAFLYEFLIFRVLESCLVVVIKEEGAIYHAIKGGAGQEGKLQRVCIVEPFLGIDDAEVIVFGPEAMADGAREVGYF